MTPEKIKKFTDTIVEDLEFAIYQKQVDQADDIQELQELEADPELQTLISETEAHNATLKGLTSSKEDKKKAKQIDLTLRGVIFRIGQINIRRDKLYKTIDSTGNQVIALKTKVERVKAFDIDKIPSLPFIELEGTRYKADENRVSRDEKGNPILYLAAGKE